MREILFRGKRLDKDKWVEGYYTAFNPDIGNDIAVIESRVNDYVVSLDTVGQYTGLTDKNGKKIFEGDVIRAVLPETVACREYVWPLMAVAFSDGAFGVWQSQREFTPLQSFATRVQFEVIGNIHDNPDMLEVRHG